METNTPFGDNSSELNFRDAEGVQTNIDATEEVISSEEQNPSVTYDSYDEIVS